jgi:aryl-alcohol dehydrogenase-like predicted oxidoreductase
MDYRNLGRTGCKVSPLCLGTMNFGGRTEPKEGVRIIQRALDDGINFVDTANVYNHGESEKVVGQALKEDDRRRHTVVATKVFGTWDPDDPNGRGNSRRHILEQVERSLQRLQTDWIDLYQIHRPMSSIPIDETLRALDDLIRAGKVRYIGTSTYPAWRLTEALFIAKELGLNRFVCEQPPYHPLDRRIERELLPFCRTYGVGTIPWSPLAGGFLTGKYSRDGEWPDDSRFGRKEEQKRQDFSDRAFDILETVEALAGEAGCTPSQWALAWCAQQPGVTSPIIGPRTMEQYEDNLGALEVEVTDEARRRLDEVATPGGVTVPFYEADFAPLQYR